MGDKKAKAASGKKHPFADLIGLSIETRDNGVCLSTLTISEKLFNPYNTVHGAVLYALADTGMGAALSRLLNSGEYCATIEIKITYFKPVSQGKLACESKVINKGNRIASLESEIYNNEKLVAKAYGTFSISQSRNFKQV
jgi:acyl-CoA thioesterase